MQTQCTPYHHQDRPLHHHHHQYHGVLSCFTDSTGSCFGDIPFPAALIYIYIYIHIYIYIYMCVCMSVCLSVCLSVCVYVCLFLCVLSVLSVRPPVRRLAGLHCHVFYMLTWYQSRELRISPSTLARTCLEVVSVSYKARTSLVSYSLFSRMFRTTRSQYEGSVRYVRDIMAISSSDTRMVFDAVIFPLKNDKWYANCISGSCTAK